MAGFNLGARWFPTWEDARAAQIAMAAECEFAPEIEALLDDPTASEANDRTTNEPQDFCLSATLPDSAA